MQKIAILLLGVILFSGCTEFYEVTDAVFGDPNGVIETGEAIQVVGTSIGLPQLALVGTVIILFGQLMKGKKK